MKPLELSRILHHIRRASDSLSNLHHYRYGHFVQSSPQGENCRYAKLTLSEFPSERDSLKESLEELRTLIDQVLEQL